MCVSPILGSHNWFQNYFLLQSAAKSVVCVIGEKGFDVHQHASEPFPPLALTTNLSLDLAAKSVLKPVVAKLKTLFAPMTYMRVPATAAPDVYAEVNIQEFGCF